MSDQILRDCFGASFSRFAEKQAIVFLRDGRVETQMSYAQLNRDSDQMAHTFRNLGVAKGDRVVLFLQKSLAFVVAHLALQKIGAIAVPLNPGFKQAEMEYLLGDADAKLILLEPVQTAMVNQIQPGLARIVVDTQRPYPETAFFRNAPDDPIRVEIEADAPGLIIYTSGTTGKPKGAMLTQKNLVQDAHNIIHIWEIAESDVLCHALPLFHIHGLCFALHTALMAGAGVIMLDRFVPQQVMKVLTRKTGERGCTLFMAVPAMYAKLMDPLGAEKLDFTHIRLWTSGSAPLLTRDFERIEAIFGQEPVEREGMSETGMNFSNPLRGPRKPGSIGLPLPDLDVRIVDPVTFQDVASGQVGEIWLKGPAVTPGYWRKPKETADAFMQGWFRTGDMGRMDADGYYYLTDRIKHIIISGGENISPKEIEEVINRMEAVAESSVVGVPDETWGEKIVAVVVPSPGARITAREIKAFCRDHLHDWKCPKEILLLEELPKNTMGKVLKQKIKQLFSQTPAEP